MMPTKDSTVECSDNQSSLGIVVVPICVDGDDQCLLLVRELVLGCECIYGQFEHGERNCGVWVVDEGQVVGVDAYNGSWLLNET